VIAGFSVLVGITIFSRSQNVVKAGASYRDQVTKDQVTHELSVIFANPAICRNIVKVSGTTFQINGGFQTGTGANAVLSADTRFRIRAMRLENIVSLGGGANSADFVVLTQNTADPNDTKWHRSAFNAAYTADASGNLTDCHIIVSAAAACTELGITYSGGRCQLCEVMGGAWSGSACSLPE
jgi:hypothetical protein